MVSELKLLLVENETDYRESIRTGLASLKLAILEANDGQEALDILSSEPFVCLIIADLEMPKVNGIELLLEMRRRKIKHPTILMSSVNNFQKDDAMLFGASDFYSKHRPISNLLEIARSVLLRSLND